MAEEATDLVLEHLRHIRGVVDETPAEMKHFILRVGLAERNVVSLHVSEGAQNGELDCIKERLDRIERRPELVDP